MVELSAVNDIISPMGMDISLILTSGKSLADIIKAGQESDPVSSVLEVADPPKDEHYDNFADYLKDILADNVLKDASDFNRRAGFVASWILSSIKPAWYLRNCSISLFLEAHKESIENWSRYTSDWKGVLPPDMDIENRFTDANYSLGCLISPENCRNFLTDYKENLAFKQAVDKHFGIFVATLFDALQTAVETSTDLVESTDIFIVYMMNPQTYAWQFNDQYSYSTNTYNETGVALQAFSIEAQVYGVQAKSLQSKGEDEKAEAYLEARQSKIDMMVQNGNAYADKVKARSNIDIPKLTPQMW